MVRLFRQHAIDDDARCRRHLAAVRPVSGLRPSDTDLRDRSRHIVKRGKGLGGTLVVLQLHSQVAQHEPGVDIPDLPGQTTLQGIFQRAHLARVATVHDLRCPGEQRRPGFAPDGIEANRDN